MPDQNSPKHEPMKSESEKEIFAVEPESAGVPKLDAPPILEGEDPSADFDVTPGGESRAGTGSASGVKVDAKASGALESKPPFVKEGMGSPRNVAIAGGIALAAAAVLAIVYHELPWYKAVPLTVYNTLAHTAAGVAAVVLAARLAERPLGRVELSAARMLLAVAATTAVFTPNYELPYTGRVDEVVLALAVYAGVTFTLFRFSWRDWQIVAGSHAVMSVLIWIGQGLYAWVATQPPK